MTRAPMPSAVRVGCHAYAIVRKPGISYNGECQFDSLQITVKARLRRSKAQEILLHEVLHACTHPTLNGGRKLTDEDFVDGVAPTLLQVIQDNPGLLEFLRT